MFAMPSSHPEYSSAVRNIIDAEERRQWDKLVLIPSESICHPDVADVLSSVFSNVYAEGQPAPPLMHDSRTAATDAARFESWQRRLADGRYYKGCVDANRIELLAQENIARVYAALEGSPAAEDIYVCAQALSGAPANTAVYEALLEHGDVVLGLDLSHGGHLTHGSEFNYSGKTFEVHSYGIDPQTRRLDYAQIRAQALECKPKLIIGGASSYPWDFDWAEMRSIADEVGAYLLADIAHLAGMVAAGLLNNPVPHAHIVTHTTHKTLCGPRGAVILTTYPELIKKLNSGVFPGLQGGPHLHTIAAIARLFEIIHHERDDFVALQQTILDNTAWFAKCLDNEGLDLEYGGTNTHMLLVDLKRFTGHPHPEFQIDGEIASRLLELAGIVCNKNVLPGDETGGKASGIRMGMPWATQRGITRDQIADLASVVNFVLSNVHTFRVWVPAGEERCRGKVPPGMLDEAAARTRAIRQALPYPEGTDAAAEAATYTTVGDKAAVLLRGDKVMPALSQMLTCAVEGLDQGEAATGEMLADDGGPIAEVSVINLGTVGREERFALLATPDVIDAVVARLRGLSDGYLLFDNDDLYAKIDGPMVVSALPDDLASALPADLPAASPDLSKPYFIGQRVKYADTPPPAKRPYAYDAPDLPLRKTVLNDAHRELGGKMVPFAGWEMPVQYPDGIFAEHRAVRSGAGLFDVSHMNLFEISGAHALPFLDVVLANCVSRLDPGEAQYTYLLRPDGTAIDDMYVYRLERDRFMLVANAANAEADWDWINAVNSREVMIDPLMPGKQAGGAATIRNLRDDGLLGLALQGPASTKLLCLLADKAAERARIERIVQNQIIPVTLAGHDCSVARTGYTGERIGFEVYVHPAGCVDIWNTLLDKGKPLGVMATGLGTRDSTRTEAGFPLFGHELEGPCGLSLTEASYGFVTRFHVPFFIGRDAYMARTRDATQQVIRLTGQGRKSVRPGHVLIDSDDNAIGQVTSFAYVKENFTFFALASVRKELAFEPGQVVRGVRKPADRYAPPAAEAAVVELTVTTRFPDDDERDGWPALYA
jgi:glycine hydroxymethyltransferase